MIEVNGKLQQPNPAGRYTAQTLQEWVPPPGKEPRLAEVLTKGGGAMEWVVEDTY